MPRKIFPSCLSVQLSSLGNLLPCLFTDQTTTTYPYLNDKVRNAVNTTWPLSLCKPQVQLSLNATKVENQKISNEQITNECCWISRYQTFPSSILCQSEHSKKETPRDQLCKRFIRGNVFGGKIIREAEGIGRVIRFWTRQGRVVKWNHLKLQYS